MSRNPNLTRRRTVQNAGAVLLGLGVSPRMLASALRGPADTDDTPGPTWAPLGPLARSKGISFGFALNTRLLANDPAYAALAARECTICVPENAMKWEALHPAPGQYTFTQADALVAFAEQHSIKVRGHNFCWHRALPAWVTQNTTRDNAEAVLRQHITTVARHFKGKIHSWDVVNEAIQLRDKQPDGWRNSFWYEMLGPRYVDIAFQTAREADPAAVLTYNDFGLEYENHTDTPKRAAVLAMLQDLKKRGIPVQGLGLQAHLRAGTGEKFGSDLPQFIDEVHALGLQVYLTELDVDDSHLTTEGAARDAAIADVYKRFLDLTLGTGKVSVVITWGAWDIAKVTGAEAVSGPKGERPLLFSPPDGQPKADAFAVAECFRQAPSSR